MLVLNADGGWSALSAVVIRCPTVGLRASVNALLFLKNEIAVARCIGVTPRESGRFGLAPRLSSSFTTRMRPVTTAMCSGDMPLSFCIFTISGFASSKSRAMRTLLSLARTA